MARHFCVDAVRLAHTDLCLDRLEKAVLTRQISSAIEEFRDGLPHQRAPRAFPH